MTQPSPPGARWKPLVVCSSDDMARRLLSALADLGFADAPLLTEYPSPGSMEAVGARYAANICFLEMTGDQERALLLISEAAPIMAVVPLNPQSDAEMMLRALRRGAADFVSDLSAAQVRQSSTGCRRERRRRNWNRRASSAPFFPASPAPAPARWLFSWRAR